MIIKLKNMKKTTNKHLYAEKTWTCLALGCRRYRSTGDLDRLTNQARQHPDMLVRSTGSYRFFLWVLESKQTSKVSCGIQKLHRSRRAHLPQNIVLPCISTGVRKEIFHGVEWNVRIFCSAVILAIFQSAATPTLCNPVSLILFIVHSYME